MYAGVLQSRGGVRIRKNVAGELSRLTKRSHRPFRGPPPKRASADLSESILVKWEIWGKTRLFVSQSGDTHHRLVATHKPSKDLSESKERKEGLCLMMQSNPGRAWEGKVGELSNRSKGRSGLRRGGRPPGGGRTNTPT